MDFLSGLFGAKKPLTSTGLNRPNSNQFMTNNPEVVPREIQQSFAKFLAAWKRQQINESERHRVVLVAFAKEHPAEMKAFLEGRLAPSSPDVRGLPAENVGTIKQFILQAGGRRGRKTRGLAFARRNSRRNSVVAPARRSRASRKNRKTRKGCK